MAASGWRIARYASRARSLPVKARASRNVDSSGVRKNDGTRGGPALGRAIQVFRSLIKDVKDNRK